MEKPTYTEETITGMSSSTRIHEHIQILQDDLGRLETERDEMLVLLYEMVDAEGSEELEEVLICVREFVENQAYPAPY